MGPSVPVSLDRASAAFSSSSGSFSKITIKFAKGRYHEVIAAAAEGGEAAAADAVFAPDAVRKSVLKRREIFFL